MFKQTLFRTLRSFAAVKTHINHLLLQKKYQNYACLAIEIYP